MRVSSICVACVLVASPVRAQWSVTAFLGDAATSNTALRIESPADGTSLVANDVALADDSFDSPVYYGGRITRRLARPAWLALEVELIHLKTISNPAQIVLTQGRLEGAAVDIAQPLAAVLPKFELSHGLNMLLVNAVAHHPLVWRDDHWLLEISGRAGAGPTIPHVESSFLGRSENGYQLGRPALAAAIGIAVRISSRFAGVLELKASRTRQHVEVGAATVEGTMVTRHVVAGITWHLSAAGHRPFMR